MHPDIKSNFPIQQNTSPAPTDWTGNADYKADPHGDGSDRLAFACRNLVIKVARREKITQRLRRYWMGRAA